MQFLVLLFMGKKIHDDLESDQDEQRGLRELEGRRSVGSQKDREVHDNDTLVGLDKEGGGWYRDFLSFSNIC